MPPELTEGLVDDLRGVAESELRSLFDQLLYHPEMDSPLQVHLPGIVTPDIDRAMHAHRHDEDEVFDEAPDKVVAATGTPDRQIALAQAVIELREESRLFPKILRVGDLGGGCPHLRPPR